MVDPAFNDWLLEFNGAPVKLPFTPALKEFSALMKDRKWQDFRNELIERAKTDPAFLAGARSKAEGIYETVLQLKDVTDDMWPSDPHSFTLAGELGRCFRR